MFDAVDATIERGRAAIADRRLERCVRTKTENKLLGLNSFNGRRMLDRKRTLLDRSRKEAHGHRAAIEATVMRRQRRPFRIAIRRQLLERAMVGRLFRLVHRLAISDARRSRAVQTDEYRHEQCKEPSFERMLTHQLNYRLRKGARYVTFVTPATNSSASISYNEGKLGVSLQHVPIGFLHCLSRIWCFRHRLAAICNGRGDAKRGPDTDKTADGSEPQACRFRWSDVQFRHLGFREG